MAITTSGATGGGARRRPQEQLSGGRSGFSRAADDERARLSFLTILIRGARIVLEPHAGLRHAASGIPNSARRAPRNDDAPLRGESGRGGTPPVVFVRVDGSNSVASIHASAFDQGCSAAHESQ